MLYIIFNPQAGRGSAAQQEPSVRTALSAAGLAFELVRTTHAGHAQELARSAAEGNRYSAVVAAGGDGTINEVVNGLLGSDTPLGLVPLGTGNDLVKLFDLPPDQPAIAAQRLRDGRPRPIDLGIANGRAFTNGLGCGFDAQVTVESRRSTRLRGFAVYLVALVRALAHYQSPRMRVTFDGETIEGRMLLATVANGRCQGGGFWLTPDAQPDDGRLDLCLVEHLRLDEIVRYVPKVLRGTHMRLRQVRMAQVGAVTIQSDAPIPMHVDGELLGTALREVAVEIRPGALKLLV